MGWGSGGDLARKVWDIVRLVIPETERMDVARKIWDAFEHHDCDTLYEVKKLANDCKWPKCKKCRQTIEGIDGKCWDCT